MGRKAVKRSHSETKKSSPVTTLLTSDEITNGISSLKKAVSWSTEDEIIPVYNDDSATIYLQFAAAKNIKGTNPIGRVNLPHPLSYKRSVCLIARGAVDDTTVAPKLKALFNEIGIRGKVKVIPVEEIKASLTAKNHEELYKLAESYDTYLAEKKVLSDIAVHALYAQMSKHGKHVNLIVPKADQDMKKTLEEGLTKSYVLPNSTLDAYVWKVAHTGMTDEQIQENVQAALDKFSTWTASFPEGLRHFKTVHLKTGDTDGVPVYTNSGDVVEELPYQRHENQEYYPKADDQLYWMNRMQEEDGNPYWKINDKKMRMMIKDKAAAKTSVDARENLAGGRVKRLQMRKKQRNAEWRSNRNFEKKGSSWMAGTPGSGKKSPFKPRTPKSPHNNTPRKARTPGSGKKSPFNTPGSGKKQTPLKANTPGSAKKSPFKPQTPNTATPDEANTPGSGERQTPLKANTPVQAKEPTPLKPITPASTNKQAPLKENTPGSAKVQSFASPGNINTPSSGGKKKRSRKSKVGGSPANTPQQGTPAAGTPGSGGKIKMRLRQRASAAFKN